jgi:hypothetical protein
VLVVVSFFRKHFAVLARGVYVGIVVRSIGRPRRLRSRKRKPTVDAGDDEEDEEEEHEQDDDDDDDDVDDDNDDDEKEGVENYIDDWQVDDDDDDDDEAEKPAEDDSDDYRIEDEDEVEDDDIDEIDEKVGRAKKKKNDAVAAAADTGTTAEDDVDDDVVNYTSTIISIPIGVGIRRNSQIALDDSEASDSIAQSPPPMDEPLDSTTTTTTTTTTTSTNAPTPTATPTTTTTTTTTTAKSTRAALKTSGVVLPSTRSGRVRRRPKQNRDFLYDASATTPGLVCAEDLCVFVFCRFLISPMNK